MSNMLNSRIQATGIVLLLLTLIVSASYAFQGDSNVDVVKARQDIGTEQETRDHAVLMRLNHPDLLRHKRDLTMRQGIRSDENSLKQCVSCHVSQDNKGLFIPINADKQFCSGCHQLMAVKPDCFSCHATIPANGELVVSRERAN